MPHNNVRYDNEGHLPLWNDKRNRCKGEGYVSFSFIKCEKCGVSLCLNKNKNYFSSFHTV